MQHVNFKFRKETLKMVTCDNFLIDMVIWQYSTYRVTRCMIDMIHQAPNPCSRQQVKAPMEIYIGVRDVLGDLERWTLRWE